MDRRIRKTKEAIVNAYISLREKRPTGRITVTELAKAADIDRKTFYLHYDSVEKIMEEFCNERVEELIYLLEASDFYNQPVKVNLAVGALHQMIVKDVETYRQLASNSDYAFFWQTLQSVIVKAVVRTYSEKIKVSQEELTLYAELFTGGLIHIYLRWLKGELRMTLEQIGESAVHLAEYGIMDYMQE